MNSHCVGVRSSRSCSCLNDSVSLEFHETLPCARMCSSTRSRAIRSSVTEHPGGRDVKPVSTCDSIKLERSASKAPSRSLNRNSRRYCPTKSNAVRQSLFVLGQSRRPRPSCCTKIVRLSVGRINSTVSRFSSS